MWVIIMASTVERIRAKTTLTTAVEFKSPNYTPLQKYSVLYKYACLFMICALYGYMSKIMLFIFMICIHDSLHVFNSN